MASQEFVDRYAHIGKQEPNEVLGIGGAIIGWLFIFYILGSSCSEPDKPAAKEIALERKPKLKK